MNTTDSWSIAVIVGLAAVTVVSRCLFFMSSKPWPLPGWAERGLKYAPIAALSAVVLPEIVMVQGQLIGSWQDARVFSAGAATAVFFWRRSVLWTLIVGMAVYLPLRIGLGW